MAENTVDVSYPIGIKKPICGALRLRCIDRNAQVGGTFKEEGFGSRAYWFFIRR